MKKHGIRYQEDHVTGRNIFMQDQYTENISMLYQQMDKLYNHASSHYGLSCEGCKTNCCATKFHHYTHIEGLYLRQGILSLSPKSRDLALKKAVETVRIYGNSSPDVQAMCPLNDSGKCIVYEYRPMICRLHGVPHEIHKPGVPVEHGTGCQRFIEEEKHKAEYFIFDRTGFYLLMAQLEMQYKAEHKITAKLKKTIAEMVNDILGKN